MLGIQRRGMAEPMKSSRRNRGRKQLACVLYHLFNGLIDREGDCAAKQSAASDGDIREGNARRLERNSARR